MLGSNIIVLLLVIISVAIHHASGETTVEARFNMNGETGFVRFVQSNATSNVTMSTHLKKNETVFITIKQHPVQYTGGLAMTCTVEQYGQKVFDLGQFTRNTTSHWDLRHVTLFGKDSIIGRTLLLSSTPDMNTPTACANLLPVTPSYSRYSDSYATATFSNSRIAGQISFTDFFGAFKETLITGLMYTTDGSSFSKNNWYIANEGLTSEGECRRPQDTTKVQGGDLAQKHERLSIGRINGQMEKVRYIDTDLHLRYIGGIIGKYLYVTDSSTQTTLGCAKIARAGALDITSVFTPEAHQGVNGTMNFRQVSPYHPTEVTIHMEGLNKRVRGYHIHNFPISDKQNPCAGFSSGGHLNPFGVDPKKAPPPGTDSCDKYEVGDLSARFGSLKGKDSVTIFKHDMNIPLFGKYSCVGLPIVIHRDDDANSRFTCNAIEPQGGKVLKGELDFAKTSYLVGKSTLVQYIQRDGVVSQTLMALLLNHANASKVTRNHMWHIHIGMVQGDGKADVGRCASEGGHYNPNMVNVTDATNYKGECKPKYPWRCELGDTSRKHMMYDVGGGKVRIHDEYTPLFGDESVLGRGITIHEANGAASRLACADIEPVASDGAIQVHYDVAGYKNKGRTLDMKDQLAKALGFGSANWKITFLKTMNVTRSTVHDDHDHHGHDHDHDDDDDELDDDCFHASFYILDDRNPQNAKGLKEQFEKIMKDDKDKLGDFKPCGKAAANSVIASILALVNCVALAITFNNL